MRTIIFLSLISALIAYAYASCGDCCTSGTCNAAFRDAPGVCCGVRNMGGFEKPFCCPANSSCISAEGGGFRCRLSETPINFSSTTANTPETIANTAPVAGSSALPTVLQPNSAPNTAPGLLRDQPPPPSAPAGSVSTSPRGPNLRPYDPERYRGANDESVNRIPARAGTGGTPTRTWEAPHNPEHETVGSHLRGAASEVGAAGAAAGAAVVSGVSRAGHAVTEGARDAGHAVAEGARDAGHTVVEGAREAGHTVAEGASSVGRTIREGASSAGHAVADGASAVGRTVRDSATTAGEKVKEGASSATSAIKDTASRISKGDLPWYGWLIVGIVGAVLLSALAFGLVRCVRFCRRREDKISISSSPIHNRRAAIHIRNN